MTRAGRSSGRIYAALCAVMAGICSRTLQRPRRKRQRLKEQPTSFWMKKKLEYSQNILGGIANDDFDKIVAKRRGHAQSEQGGGLCASDKRLAIVLSFISSRREIYPNVVDGM